MDSTQSILWWSLAVLMGLAIVNYIWRRRHLYIFASKLSGPATIPLLGNALEFMCKQTEILDRVVELIKKYPSPMRFWLGSKLLIIVKEVEDIEKVLSSQKMTYKDDVYNLMQPYIGQGLISGSGPKWKAHRKLIIPTLGRKILEGYVDVFHTQTNILIKKMEASVGKNSFDVIKLIHNCTVDIVCETILDVKTNSQKSENNLVVYWFDKMYALIHERIMKVWLHPDCIYKLTNIYTLQKQGVVVVREFMQKAIDCKKSEMKARKKGILLDRQSDLKERSTMEQLLELMEENTDLIDHEELIDEMLTLFTASQDTTATQTGFVLLILGMYPDIQDKVVKEVNEVLGKSESFTYTDLGKLKYLEMVLKESLRLFTIAPFIIRKVREDFPLTTCTLPKGSSVTIPIHVVHRDPKHWERPEEFYPEHFLPDAVAKRHPYAFTPFSSGPRACIGQQYAYSCLKTMIALVLKRYRIDTDGSLKDIKLWCDITCRPINGFMIRISYR